MSTRVKELRIIPGRICDRIAFQLIHKNKIKHFRFGSKYLIPKAYLIDFMMSNKDEKKQKILFLCEKPQTRKGLMFLLDVKSKKTFLGYILSPCWNRENCK